MLLKVRCKACNVEMSTIVKDPALVPSIRKYMQGEAAKHAATSEHKTKGGKIEWP